MIDWNKKEVHFIGVGGIGMSGLARLLLDRSATVSGSDLSPNYTNDALANSGAKIHIGHAKELIKPEMTVIYTTGIQEDNPEYSAAVSLNCPLLHRSQLLAQLMQGSQALSVAGTHGKTTTSALLSYVLHVAGADPSFAIGGTLPQLSSNARYGKGEHFVFEACESDGSFLNYSSFGSIITNIDFDHMEYFQTEKALIEAFSHFIGNVSSKHHLFWCGDDPCLQQMAPVGVSYGFSPNCHLKISHFEQKGWQTTFDITFKGRTYQNIQLALLGVHNALNGAAVFGLALSLGIEESAIRQAFASFAGVLRRGQKKAEMNGILFLDDYAHHPTEIKATLQGIRNAIGDKHLIVLYQPHRYTRAQECLGNYTGCFDAADELVITDLYSAGESPIEGVNNKTIFEDIKQGALVPIEYLPADRLISNVSKRLKPHDVVVSMGAGDITTAADRLVDELKKSPFKKFKIGLIFGGASLEHEISLLSAKNVAAGLRSDLYEVEYFAISKKGTWIAGFAAHKYLYDPVLHDGSFGEQVISHEVFMRLADCDIAFPVLHGPFGEDGTLQGFLDILGIAYVGCSHSASAVCMDKVLTKQLVGLHGIATAEFLSFSFYEWKTQKKELLQKISASLPFPLFIKPVHLGSALGVSKVDTLEDVSYAIQKVFEMDTHVIVERGLSMRELEFAVIGNDQVEVFPPGEILSDGLFYDYECKYGSNSTKVNPQAELPLDLIEKGKAIAKQAYKLVGGAGMARIDLFLDEEQKFWLNEINPIPGFTKNSLYPKMCEVHGLPISDLLDRLIILGLQRKRLQEQTLKIV